MVWSFDRGWVFGKDGWHGKATWEIRANVWGLGGRPCSTGWLDFFSLFAGTASTGGCSSPCASYSGHIIYIRSLVEQSLVMRAQEGSCFKFNVFFCSEIISSARSMCSFLASSTSDSSIDYAVTHIPEQTARAMYNSNIPSTLSLTHNLAREKPNASLGRWSGFAGTGKRFENPPSSSPAGSGLWTDDPFRVCCSADGSYVPTARRERRVEHPGASRYYRPP